MVGPTGKYPAGKPYFEGDVGGIDSEFKIVPPNCVWSFGVVLNEIVLTTEKARVIVDSIRELVEETFPDAQPAARLRGITVFAEADMTIRVVFGKQRLADLTAEPAFFLAMLDRIDKEIRKIERHRR